MSDETQSADPSDDQLEAEATELVDDPADTLPYEDEPNGSGAVEPVEVEQTNEPASAGQPEPVEAADQVQTPDAHVAPVQEAIPSQSEGQDQAQGPDSQGQPAEAPQEASDQGELPEQGNEP